MVLAGEPGQLELVGRDDVGCRHGMVPEELGDARPDEEAPALVAHDRVAGVEHVVPRGPHAGDGAQHRLAEARVAQIARQHGADMRDGATLGDPLDDLLDPVQCHQPATPGAVAGMVAEQHRVDRPDLETQPLQREHRGTVADMAVGHGRLDREDAVLHVPSKRARAADARGRAPQPRQRLAGGPSAGWARARGAAMSQAPADLRQNYDRDVLLEAQALADPVLQFERWFDRRARRRDLRAQRDGAWRRSGRTASHRCAWSCSRGSMPQGFVFYTNLESRKAAGARPALPKGGAAVLVGPPASPGADRGSRSGLVTDAEADAYFASRPHGSRIGAAASPQSRVIDGRDALEARVAELAGAAPGRGAAPGQLGRLPRAADAVRVLAGPPEPAPRPVALQPFR